MASRLYEVTITIMRDGFKRAFVNVYHVAASDRRRAAKNVRDRAYTQGADAVTVSCKCLGAMTQTEYRCLKEQT
jgi:hypothetical protein